MDGSPPGQSITWTARDDISCGRYFMWTYSDVVRATPEPVPAVCEEKLKTVVRDVMGEENSGKKLIIHGISEDAEECLSEKVLTVSESLGLKPCVEVSRIGRNVREQSQRPVKVVFSNSTSAQQVLSKSSNLRLTRQFKSVYVSPDRNYDKRKLHKELVLELKKKKSELPQFNHYINKWQSL